MKRIYIMMMLLLTGIMAEAQTSVWDGSRKLWTRGEGTADNPYLIESAENLAFLAYMVDKGFETSGLYFRLTVDIDLNGSEDQPWCPIGLYNRWFSEDGCDRGNLNATGYSPYTVFRGHFDGCGHRISNIYVNMPGYAGLFGYAGERSNEALAVIENVYVTNGFIKGSDCGGIAGYASGAVISHCWNGASIEGSSVGGIVGSHATSVQNCYNLGDLNGTYVGGIVGQFGSEVVECYNKGNITASSSGGGIMGVSSRATINNCYNTGAVFVEGEQQAQVYPVAGGLVGIFAYGSPYVLTNSYSIGEVSCNNLLGCLVGWYPASVEVDNCYYLNTCVGDEYGEAKNEDEMREPAFVALLNNGNKESVWGMDLDNSNNGFPVLVRTGLSVDSHTEKELTIYPNPTNGMVNIEGMEAAQVQVYNVFGQLVKTGLHSNEINMEGLPQGVYFLNVFDEKGNRSTCKVLKK